MILHHRWFVAGLLFVGMLLAYLDRTAISVAAPLIAKDLRLQPSQMGMIFSSFFVGYAIMAVIGGYLADQLSSRWMYAASMGGWSLFCGLTAAASGFAWLLGIRFLFGMAEGPQPSLNNCVVNNWFPKREKAGAIGVINSGVPLGSAIAGPLVSTTATLYGWRSSFEILALISAVWLVVLICFLRDNPADAQTGRQTEPLAASSQDIPSLSSYLRLGTVWATSVAFFGYMYINFFFLTWFPSYLTMTHNTSMHNMGLATSLLWIAGFFGIVIGGFMSNILYRRTGKAVFSRKAILVPCLLGSGLCAIWAGMASNVSAAIALMVLATFLLKATTSCYWVLVLDTVDRSRVGTISGLVHAISIVSGIIGPAITGVIVQLTGNFSAAFLLAGLLGITGALVAALFIKTHQVSNKMIGVSL